MYKVTFEFKNAGSFMHNPRNDKHQILHGDGTISKRKEDKTGSYRIDVPPNTLLLEHVENVLRVFIGLRPIPTFRKTTSAHLASSKSQDVREMAKGSKIEITQGLNLEGKNVVEMMTVRKAIKDSWIDYECKLNFNVTPLTTVISWNLIKERLDDNLFEEFCSICENNIGKDYRTFDMVTIFEKLYEIKSDDLKRFCATPKISKIYSEVLLNGKTYGQFFCRSGQFGGLSHWHYHMVNKGIEGVNRKSGFIHVLMPKEKIRLLDNGMGFANLLDGGIVRITSILDADDCEFEGESPISLKTLRELEHA